MIDLVNAIAGFIESITPGEAILALPSVIGLKLILDRIREKSQPTKNRTGITPGEVCALCRQQTVRETISSIVEKK